MRTAMLITALVLAGCSAAPAQPRAKSDGIAQAAVGFSQCMRDHGHQVPDPTFDDQGLPQFEESDAARQEPSYPDDRRQCRIPLNNALAAAGVPNRKGTPDQWLAFARCMRDHGVDMPDPAPDTLFRVDGTLYDSPAWATASEACEQHIPPEMWVILQRPPGKGGTGK